MIYILSLKENWTYGQGTYNTLLLVPPYWQYNLSLNLSQGIEFGILALSVVIKSHYETQLSRCW